MIKNKINNIYNLISLIIILVIILVVALIICGRKEEKSIIEVTSTINTEKLNNKSKEVGIDIVCLLYTSQSPRDYAAST